MDINKKSQTGDGYSLLKVDAAYSQAADHFNNGRYAEAERLCNAILLSLPNHIDSINILGVIAQRINRHDLAVEEFQRVINIDNSKAIFHYNLGISLYQLGQREKALQVLETALEKDPENSQIADYLNSIHNKIATNARTRGEQAKAQEAMQWVTPKYIDTPMIADETVQQLYQQCQSILASDELGGDKYPSQFYRGITPRLWKNAYPGNCARHELVFDKFQIIPEFCFNCFKVLIEPRTVVELFKLMLVFDSLELPRDNTRKCMVENRPKVSGTYKGYIYCQSLDEGKEFLKIVRTIVDEKISKKISISIKRGCSEFQIAYPEYGHIGDDKSQMMTYNEEWRGYEDYSDKNLVGHINPYLVDTFNHSGFNLWDARVMRTWLAYAATIGDSSYLKISKSPLQPLTNVKRPTFQPVEDE